MTSNTPAAAPAATPRPSRAILLSVPGLASLYRAEVLLRSVEEPARPQSGAGGSGAAGVGGAAGAGGVGAGAAAVIRGEERLAGASVAGGGASPREGGEGVRG
ncbi:hypothetical protein BU16DRAFT_565908 [Lophium mytilinum]|uniref:Uncharacterized protein n=1 Tax=Lophium mytilinum TaxID=390894 RepID=A0A6A6QF12_9PEZI|nr:hypothetical protein BU16DRAFT_565908 [Lophium mytilinum]